MSVVVTVALSRTFPSRSESPETVIVQFSLQVIEVLSHFSSPEKLYIVSASFIKAISFVVDGFVVLHIMTRYEMPDERHRTAKAIDIICVFLNAFMRFTLVTRLLLLAASDKLFLLIAIGLLSSPSTSAFIPSAAGSTIKTSANDMFRHANWIFGTNDSVSR